MMARLFAAATAAVLGLLLALSACGGDDDEPAISECVADMEAASSVPGLREDLMEHNQELHPTFTSCTSVEEWEAATVVAGLDDLVDAGFIEGECAFNPGVSGSPLCEVFAASQE